MRLELEVKTVGQMKIIRIEDDDDARGWCEEQEIADEMMAAVRTLRWQDRERAHVAMRKHSVGGKIALACLFDGFVHGENGWSVYLIDEIQPGEMLAALVFLMDLEEGAKKFFADSLKK